VVEHPRTLTLYRSASMSIYSDIFESLRSMHIDHKAIFKSLEHISSFGFPAREGWTHTEEAKEKIRARARMPRGPQSKETRKKISESHLGVSHPQSEETRRKISEGSKKRAPISEETRRKQSESARNRKPSNKKRNRKPVSEETKRKISETLKAKTSSSLPRE